MYKPKITWNEIQEEVKHVLGEFPNTSLRGGVIALIVTEVKELELYKLVKKIKFNGNPFYNLFQNLNLYITSKAYSAYSDEATIGIS